MPKPELRWWPEQLTQYDPSEQVAQKLDMSTHASGRGVDEGNRNSPEEPAPATLICTWGLHFPSRSLVRGPARWRRGPDRAPRRCRRAVPVSRMWRRCRRPGGWGGRGTPEPLAARRAAAADVAVTAHFRPEAATDTSNLPLSSASGFYARIRRAHTHWQPSTKPFCAVNIGVALM